jgi:hypothetical protein
MSSPMHPYFAQQLADQHARDLQRAAATRAQASRLKRPTAGRWWRTLRRLHLAPAVVPPLAAGEIDLREHPAAPDDHGAVLPTGPVAPPVRVKRCCEPGYAR